MSFEQLASIGELVSGIGVLATLIFLVFEVRNNSRILKANTKTSGMESFAAYNEMIGSDPVLSDLWERILTGEKLDDFDRIERMRITVIIRALMERMEAQYFQFREGLVDAEYWGARRTWVHSLLQVPAIEEWWKLESQSSHYTGQFVQHIISTKEGFRMGSGGQIQQDA